MIYTDLIITNHNKSVSYFSISERNEEKTKVLKEEKTNLDMNIREY